MTPKIKNLHADYLGGFLWFIFLWWNPLTRPLAIKWMKHTLIKTRKKGASKIAYFLMANEHYSRMIPWKYFKKDGKWVVDLSEYNPKWWKGYRQWLKLIKLTGYDKRCNNYDADEILDPLGCLFMNRYNEWIFRQNVNDVHGLYDPNALKYQTRFARKILTVNHEILSADYIPSMRFLNEPDHGGQDKPGHTIADWHRDMYLAVRDLLELENTYIDCHSEYAKAWFCKTRCPKCGFLFDGSKYGFLDEKDRPRIVPEVHGCSIIQILK